MEELEIIGNNALVNSVSDEEQHKERLFRRIKCGAVLLCFVIAVIFIVYIFRSLMAACNVLFGTETVPLWGVLRPALVLIGKLVLPILLPVILVLVASIVISILHQLYTETRRCGTLSIWAKIDVALVAAAKPFAWIISHLPNIAVVLVVAIGFNALVSAIGAFTGALNDVKRIKELTSVLKNLSRTEEISKITVLSETEEDGMPVKTYSVQILAESGAVASEQTVTLRGKEIAIDFINVNFEYSQIENAERFNLAYPYRIYSENMRPDTAEPLSCVFNDDGVPVMYLLEGTSIYGLSTNAYLSRLQELFETLKDEKASREMGIRSVNGVVPHFVMHKGDSCFVSMESTGGLSLRKADVSDTDFDDFDDD